MPKYEGETYNNYDRKKESNRGIKAIIKMIVSLIFSYEFAWPGFCECTYLAKSFVVHSVCIFLFNFYFVFVLSNFLTFGICSFFSCLNRIIVCFCICCIHNICALVFIIVI